MHWRLDRRVLTVNWSDAIGSLAGLERSHLWVLDDVCDVDGPVKGSEPGSEPLVASQSQFRDCLSLRL